MSHRNTLLIVGLLLTLSAAAQLGRYKADIRALPQDFIDTVSVEWERDQVYVPVTAGVLFLFGTGTIRGFAITLGLGVLLSMFTAITLTQFMLKLLVNAKVVESPSAYGADGFVLFDASKEAKS